MDNVSIYMRHVSLDVVIPERYVWEFMSKFGRTFATMDTMEGIEHIKAVDGYYDHPTGWHIQVNILDQDESRFYLFLRRFCVYRNLSFRDPETLTLQL